MNDEDELVVGHVVAGRYRISHKLGEGGMGSVYAAKHTELGSDVAIKVIRRDRCEDERAVQRFLQEARTASGISHPNLMHVHDLGRLDDQRPYMVMPLIAGVDCQQWLDVHGPGRPAEVASLLAGAAAGLDELHARGLVHRDIKPANIFLASEGERRSIVMDFGLAALERVGSRLTKLGTVVGTPEYLPPECADGTKTDVSGDVYSLAVVAFELIGGVLPFTAENRVKLLADKMSEDAPLLSSVAGGIGTELDAVFARALSRLRSERPTSCGALIDQIAAAANPPNPARAAVAKKKPTLLGQPTTPPETPSLIPVERARDVASISLAAVADLTTDDALATREQDAPRPPRLATRDRIVLPPKPSRRGIWLLIAALAIASVVVVVLAR